MEDGNSIIIYTDGGCRGNPGMGAWAAILINKKTNKTLEIGASTAQTTNNKMELSAAIFAIAEIEIDSNILLYSDSSYLVKGMNEWLSNWIKRGWIKSDKRPVENKELWQELYSLSLKHKITFKWVRGHVGVDGNERADSIVNSLMDAHSKTGQVAVHREII